MTQAAGTGSEADWLRIGWALGVGPSLPAGVIDRLALHAPTAAAMAVAAGLSPTDGGVAAKRLLQAALNGHCSDPAPAGISEAADLLTAFSPHLFRRLLTTGKLGSQPQRTEALRRLRDRNPAFEQAFHSMRGRRSTSGTTSRWVDTAVELSHIFGAPRWLFMEIAATALLVDSDKIRTGGAFDPNLPAFGPTMHYGTWLSRVKTNTGKPAWWQTQLQDCSNDYSRASWALSLVMAASRSVIGELLDVLDEVMEGLSADAQFALLGTSGRLGVERRGRRLFSLPRVLDLEHLTVANTTRVLLAHHSNVPTDTVGRDPGVLTQLASLPTGTDVVAAAVTKLAVCEPTTENLKLVTLFETTGGEAVGNPPPPLVTCKHILDRVAMFPTAWTRVAEMTLAGDHVPLPLRTYAETRWNLT